MQLAHIPAPVIQRNARVVSAMAAASTAVSRVSGSLEQTGRVPRGARASVATALEAARQAHEGASELGADNLLDATFHRHATHAVRHLEAAVAILERGRPSNLGTDALAILGRQLFDARVATTQGARAGIRSLEDPQSRSLPGVDDHHTQEREEDGASNGTWVDGVYLDGSGNPVRGGDDVVGEDGVAIGPDGGPAADDSWVGPDGDSFDGI